MDFTIPKSGGKEETGTQVFCFNWDLSNGNRAYGPECITNIFQHVGLLAYGSLYEYSEEGILKTEVPPHQVPTSACFAGDLIGCEELGRTSKTQEAFEMWLDGKRATDFEPSRYSILKNNCVSFAIQACGFLGVKRSNAWVDVGKHLSRIWTPPLSSLINSSSAKFASIISSLKVNVNSETEGGSTTAKPNVDGMGKL